MKFSELDDRTRSEINKLAGALDLPALSEYESVEHLLSDVRTMKETMEEHRDEDGQKCHRVVTPEPSTTTKTRQWLQVFWVIVAAIIASIAVSLGGVAAGFETIVVFLLLVMTWEILDLKELP